MGCPTWASHLAKTDSQLTRRTTGIINAHQQGCWRVDGHIKENHVFFVFSSFFGFILHIPMAKAFWGYLIEKVGSTLEVLYILLHASYCFAVTLLQKLVYGCTLCDCYFS